MSSQSIRNQIKITCHRVSFRLILQGGYIGLCSARPECVTSSKTGTVSRTPGKFTNKCSPSAIILEVPLLMFVLRLNFALKSRLLACCSAGGAYL